MAEKEFLVNHWTQDPDAEITNPHLGCVQGFEFATKGDAISFFETCMASSGISHIELTGPGIYMVRKNPVCQKDAYDAETMESVWQHRMGFGCDD